MTKNQRSTLRLIFPAILMVGWWIYLPFLHAKDHKVNHDGKVQFFVTKDREFKPVLPVVLTVTQEEGGLLDGEQIVTCDVVAHVTEVVREDKPTAAVETMFKCGERRFLLKQVIFAESR